MSKMSKMSKSDVMYYKTFVLDSEKELKKLKFKSVMLEEIELKS